MTRYIDADALHYTRIRIYHEAPDIPGGGFAGGYNAVVMSAEIHNAPTADVAPVRHGKWINREYGMKRDGKTYPFWERYECSICGERADQTTYCPNCGARMDEK